MTGAEVTNVEVVCLGATLEKERLVGGLCEEVVEGGLVLERESSEDEATIREKKLASVISVPSSCADLPRIFSPCSCNEIELRALDRVKEHTWKAVIHC